MNIVVSDRALADLRRLREFLRSQNPGAADRAALSLAKAIQSLASEPGRGRPVNDALRRELIVRFGRSAYIVRYAVLKDEGEVVVLRVWHGREHRG